MRPPTPYLAFLNITPPQSPLLAYQESPIDTLATLLSPSLSSADLTPLEDSELTPTMHYATLPTTSYSPLLQHHREQQLHALQQQQCIPGLSQIYAPMPTSFSTNQPMLSDSSHFPSFSRSSSATSDEPDADSDYTPSSSYLSRKRASPGGTLEPSDSSSASVHMLNQKTAMATKLTTTILSDDSASTPVPKRQRAAPSGPISTKDWVPPDVTGLNKREARLVKNRAAAFLSRQRKREEFEAMEVRVQELEAENARLRQSASLSPSSSSPSSSSSFFTSSAEQHHHQQLRAQLAESKAREELLAAQVRDLQAAIAARSEASRASPASDQLQFPSATSASQFPTHQPVISTWPSMSAPTPPPQVQPQSHTSHLQQQLHLASHQPSSFYQLSSSTFQFPAASRLMDSEVKMEVVEDESSSRSLTTTGSEDSDSDSDDSEQRSLKKDNKTLVAREKGSGSVAFMVLLFSLSLLSGRGHAGAEGANKADAPTAFSFNINNGVNAATQSSFDLSHLTQQQQQDASAQGQNDIARRPSTSSSAWTSSLDGLDDEFGYFDRQHAHAHGLPSSFDSGLGLEDPTSSSAYGFSYPMPSAPSTSSSGGSSVGHGDVMSMGGMGGMDMGLMMPGVGDMGMLDYQSATPNSFLSPFSLEPNTPFSAGGLTSPVVFTAPRPSTSSSTMFSGRGGSPARSIASVVSTAGFQQLEVSVRRPAEGAGSKSEVSFDLKLGGGNTNGEEAGDESSSSGDKTLTVHVRKVPSSDTISKKNKRIVLELTSSTSSSSASSSVDDNEDEDGNDDDESLNGLEADFEALLGQGLGALAASASATSAATSAAAAMSGMGMGGVDMAQWRLALAPRDILV